MSPDTYDSGVEALRARGLQVVASPAAHLPHRDREIELIVDDFVDGDGARTPELVPRGLR